MTQNTIPVCPYLGLVDDPTAARLGPDEDHRCFAQDPVAVLEGSFQEAICLTARYEQCPFHLAAVKSGLLAPADQRNASADDEPEQARRRRRKDHRGRPSVWRVLPWAALAVLALVVAVVYGRDLLASRLPALTPTGPAAAATLTPTFSPIPSSDTPPPSVAPAAADVAPAVEPVASRTSDVLIATSTPVSGGRVLALAPKAGDAGWFGSSEARGNHLGDSYLYAGYDDGQALISGLRIGLAGVPRGAPILEATLHLSGLDDGRFDPGAGGSWSVQLLAPDAVADFSRATFQEWLNAQAAVTLVPTLSAADLSVGKSNAWALDEPGRAWLEQQLLEGVETVLARIVGPTGGSETLFAWDSGSGPATLGEAPRLVLNLGAPPATPPPLPTEVVVVATLTPTPANVLTAVAHAVVATEQASAFGTPLPYRIVTPTPPAENLATAQAYVAALGMSPLVVYTPTPANVETAQANDWRATAVAVTTGTFTPVPTDAVTPVILVPTDRPVNAATALALALTATPLAERNGTPTPWAANVLVATLTPTPVTPTATPANEATAVVRSAEATLTAMAASAQTPVFAVSGPASVASPAALATGASTPGPTARPAASVTATPARPLTPTPTLSPAPRATRRPVATRRPRATARPTPTALARQSATGPALVAPARGEPVSGVVTFRWQPAGTLPPGAKYEVVWWNANENPAGARGIAPPTLNTELAADLQPLAASGAFSASDLYWTVLVVTESPYVRLTNPADTPRGLIRYSPGSSAGDPAPPKP